MMYSAKYCLLFNNGIFLVLSLILLNIGAIMKTSLDVNYRLFSEHLGVPVALTLAFGSLLTFMALFALLSVYCRSHGLLSVYICLLIALIVVELSLGLAGFLVRSFALRLFKDSLRSAESRYTNDSLVRSTWNSVQRDLKCCGVDHYEEWFDQLGNSSLPDSCCALYTLYCGRSAIKTGNFYQTDCTAAISKWTRSNGLSISILITFIILSQILSLFLSILTRFASPE